MEAKEISKAVIKRLPRYYRYLGELMEENVERISSNDLSKKMHPPGPPWRARGVFVVGATEEDHSALCNLKIG